MPNDITPLSRAATAMAKDVIKTLTPTFKGRFLASINPYLKDNGKSAYEYTLVSSMSDGFIQYEIPTDGGFKDSIVTKSRIVNIPALYKTFEMSQSDITKWEAREVGAGQDNSFPNIAASIAATKVHEQEEELIFNGWKPDGTTYEIKGFSQAAANVITGGSIATAGTLTEYIADAIGALEADNVVGENNSYNLSLPTPIMAKLRSLRYTNGDFEIEQIRRMLGDGDIYVTTNLSGTALVTPVDTARNHFELLNPVDYRVALTKSEYQEDPHLGCVKGTVYELLTPSFPAYTLTKRLILLQRLPH